MRSPRAVAGFTLLELMLGLAIAGIVLALGVPAFGGWFAEQQVQDRADALVHALDLARSEAIRRGDRVDVCPAPAACDAGALPWEGGWTVVADAARSGTPALARERSSPAGITIRGNRPVADYVSYTAAGHARRFDGALQMGTFTICRSGQRARKVILASSGRARVETATDTCP
ncbi:MAG TPA: GspH/FimT family pseudopilin [Casimicrobiaceae bacterium]|nr:GspH/FimT family pseudopilin [Casimicrobiaceae bacterium]